MNKNLPKLVKHIFPSNKKWTGVWFAGYRGLHLPFASIARVYADLVKTACNYAGFMRPARMTYKSAASDEYILSVRKEA
jgi:hypothetical protein